MWRVTRTIIRGQFANDDCFLKWAGTNVSTVGIARVENDPLNNGGPNDKRLYLWVQTGNVNYPACATPPDLVTASNRNGWETRAEAEAVLEHELDQSKVLAANIKAANAAAVDPANIAAGAAKELAGDLKDAAASSWPWLVPVGIGLGAIVAWKLFR